LVSSAPRASRVDPLTLTLSPGPGEREHLVVTVGRAMLLGAVVGATLAFAVLPPGFITGTGGLWARPENDFNAYLVAWHYFLHDQWRFPLFDLPAMGYPEGGSVLFNDALPAAALVTKVLHSLTGHAVNPFGWWMLLCYVLQGAMAARIVVACGARSWWAALGAAVFAVGSVPFMSRLELRHVAVASHFLVLWALALYCENVRARRFAAGEHFALGAVAILVNAYLFVMVSVLQATTLVTLWKGRALARSDWVKAALSVVAVVAIALAAGYGAMFSGNATMRGHGFGHFSWNLATLIVPPEGYWGVPTGIVRDATGGQYEGEAYIGLGAMLVVAVCVLARPRQAASAVRRHWILAVALLVCAAYAPSHRVFLSSHLLVEVPLPQNVLDAASVFRASGRFIWIPAYTLTLASLAGLFRWTPRALALPLLVVAIAAQLSEARVAVARLRPMLATPAPELIDTPQLRLWLQQHLRVFQFPSYWCGGLAPTFVWGSRDMNRELQIQLATAQEGLPTNSVITSRLLKDCAAEARWADRAEMQAGVLYLVSKSAVTRTPRVAALAASRACVDAGWGLVCSRESLAP
jgi:Family of unknown function (DUF6311)